MRSIPKFPRAVCQYQASFSNNIVARSFFFASASCILYNHPRPRKVPNIDLTFSSGRRPPFCQKVPLFPLSSPSWTGVCVLFHIVKIRVRKKGVSIKTATPATCASAYGLEPTAFCHATSKFFFSSLSVATSSEREKGEDKRHWPL